MKTQERIDRLKKMLAKWAKQEKKIKENELETIEERKHWSMVRRQ